MYILYLWLLSVWIATVVADSEKKHTYNIVIKTVETDSMVDEYFGRDTKFLINNFNETAAVMDAVMDFKKDAPVDMTILIVVKEFNPSTNQWVKKFSLAHKLCDFIKDNHFIMDSIYKESHFPKECPIKKGKYNIKNMVIDNSEFPEDLVESSWKAEIELNKKGNLGLPYLVLMVYADVEPLLEELEEERK